MDFSLILTNVSKYIALSKDEEVYFTSLLQYNRVKRKEFLLHEGDICRSNIFVGSGNLKVYSIDKKGFEHVVNFAPADWWTGDLASLISQKPGAYNIVALEDSELFLLAKCNQDNLYREIPKFERFFRIIIENSLVAYRQRLMDSISLSAEEQYQNFCKKYPTLLNRLPQKEIAAYLGVTPEFLSKMKTQMFRKQ